jgi:hypothetical protein
MLETSSTVPMISASMPALHQKPDTGCGERLVISEQLWWAGFTKLKAT